MTVLSCMTWPYCAFPLERALEGIARAGYRYAVLGLPHEGKPVIERCDASEAEAMLQRLQRYGLEAKAIVGTPWLAPGQPVERARQLFAYAGRLDVKEIMSLGTWGYRQFPDAPLEAQELQAADDAFLAHFKLVAAEAERAGVFVTLKPHTGNTATAAVLKRTIAAIGSPAVQPCYDPGNVQYYEGIDSAQDFMQIAEETVSLIAKDHRGPRGHADFPVPGQGDVDFAAIFRAMKARAVMVERVDGTEGGTLEADEIDRRILDARRNLEQLLQKAGLTAG